MNRALRASSASLQSTAFFHSTAVLDRSRNSRYKFNSYTLRFRRKEAKRALLRDASLYLEHLIHGFRNSRQDNPQSNSSRYTSWFEKQYFSRGRKNNQFCSQESQWQSHVNKKKGPVRFVWSDTDNDEHEATFTFTSEDDRGFYRSFHRSGGRHRGSTRYEQRHFSWNWKHDSDDEDSKLNMSDLISERLVLGLSASGPLNLKDIKSAYHTCALQWHPDRHQGSSKETAEEKFKHCTAAYKALCDRLATD